MDKNDIEVNVNKDLDLLIENGNSILFVAKNGKLLALIGVKDVIKENIKEVVRKIKEKNIEVLMLTGDNEKTAEAIAKEVGIDKIKANVLPSEKAQVVKDLKKDGLVMMCGDGINDSVSLVTADIGVSVSSGTDIAMDSSNVVIMNDNLDRINDLIIISKKTIINIKENLFWAFIYNVCMIPIAMGLLSPLGITMNPMFGALAMTLSSITVVLNALRLRNIKIK
jgi:P-type E1-E2 ATPase